MKQKTKWLILVAACVAYSAWMIYLARADGTYIGEVNAGTPVQINYTNTTASELEITNARLIVMTVPGAVAISNSGMSVLTNLVILNVSNLGNSIIAGVLSVAGAGTNIGAFTIGGLLTVTNGSTIYGPLTATNLGTAAWSNATVFGTSNQGAKADSALQAVPANYQTTNSALAALTISNGAFLLYIPLAAITNAGTAAASNSTAFLLAAGTAASASNVLGTLTNSITGNAASATLAAAVSGVLTNPVNGGAVTGTSLQVSGTSVLIGNVINGGTLVNTGAVTILGLLTTSNQNNIGASTTATFRATGNSVLVGTVIVGSTLAVTGVATFYGIPVFTNLQMSGTAGYSGNRTNIGTNWGGFCTAVECIVHGVLTNCFSNGVAK